ncbi:hypothetical protein [Streptomyces uncialis]|uniref:hypothetical protein n=1 Tax=Streptomyces uncialis TaxID=1048205 RepID=UPI003864EA54|nr:hypothetical protein OG924_12480 [Streptomyces uncialis]
MTSGRPPTAGEVAEAAAAVMAAVLADIYPGQPHARCRADARALAARLQADGWRITAPVAPAGRDRDRSRKRTTTPRQGS